MLAVSGPGTHLGLWDWRGGFEWLRWAMFAGLGAAAAALVLLVIPRTRQPRPSLLVAALLVGILAAAPTLAMLAQARSLPYIHDITTDLADPPRFVALAAVRQASPNGAQHGGPEIAAQQRIGYPSIGPMVLEAPPAEAFARALRAARAMGWEIAAADAAAGRIEATATTLWFGFKDDVIVRVRGHGTGSRIDVRSVSRVGTSDVGANARRIQQYLGEIK
jgi:uncharacterized protein (DUF1499 family)